MNRVFLTAWAVCAITTTVVGGLMVVALPGSGDFARQAAERVAAR